MAKQSRTVTQSQKAAKCVFVPSPLIQQGSRDDRLRLQKITGKSGVGLKSLDVMACPVGGEEKPREERQGAVTRAGVT